uniref:NADH dehydrogenase subunit 6 n=1 Tax=Paranemertes cf. peregrina SCS-2010 TaxID=743461 RepID=E7C197_9BILA|nr:NADH dehydrogenase subunit 6 [Paranemertes cf. peregrina SCS-2010]ADD62157.1 NADH dehydrogenase subunit 6 [Paranemertes cf. peregrina SCS-2010]
MMLAFLEISLCLLMSMALVAQQPLSMGGFLLFYSFLSSVLIFSFFSSWFSLSLFLIFIGGMLVLFGYVLVLIPNFMFSMKIYPLAFFFFFFFFSPFGEVSWLIMDFSFSFFSFSNLVVYISLGVVLFVGLISVAKICFFQVGALRPFF